jgi:hypothetical protein
MFSEFLLCNPDKNTYLKYYLYTINKKTENSDRTCIWTWNRIMQKTRLELTNNN